MLAPNLLAQTLRAGEKVARWILTHQPPFSKENSVPIPTPTTQSILILIIPACMSRRSFSSYCQPATTAHENQLLSQVQHPDLHLRQPQFRQSLSGAVSSGISTGDGGSLGIYSHVNSPLKKATSMYDIQGSGRRETPRNSFDMARQEIQDERERSKSPVKRQSDGARLLPAYGRAPLPEADVERRSSFQNASGLKQRPGNYESPYKRAPPRF
jgi:hypothetical protein